MSTKYLQTLVLLAGMTIGFACLAYDVHRNDAYMVIGAFAFLFLGYFFLVKQKALFNWKTWIWIGLGLRLIFIASGPALSDDFYRFIWDGRVLIEGENPYLVLPHDYLESPDDAFAKKLERDLYHGLNSKHYYTIYPPVNQCCFAIAAFLGDGNVNAELLYLRLIILLGEAALLFLLAKILSILQRPREDLVWYALNPLVIVELSGNLHFEGMVLLFLAAALLYFIRGKWGASAVLFALAVGTKLLPLMLLPALIPILKQRTAAYFGVVLAGLGLLFLPFMSQALFANWGSSLDLYFQKFEFNASIYYLVRWVGSLFLGYHPPIAVIGPILSVISLLIILYIALKSKFSFFQKTVLIYSVYLLLTTTVHPWYLVSLVFFTSLTKWRFAALWSFLAVLSYSHYANGGFNENYWLIGLEYGALAAFMGYTFFASRSKIITT